MMGGDMKRKFKMTFLDESIKESESNRIFRAPTLIMLSVNVLMTYLIVLCIAFSVVKHTRLSQ